VKPNVKHARRRIFVEVVKSRSDAVDTVSKVVILLIETKMNYEYLNTNGDWVKFMFITEWGDAVLKSIQYGYRVRATIQGVVIKEYYPE